MYNHEQWINFLEEGKFENINGGVLLSEKKKAKPTAREKHCKGVPGNQFHKGGPGKESGQFTNKKDAGSSSLWFSCRNLGRTQAKGKAISEPVQGGRGPTKKGKGNLRIYDNEKLWEEPTEADKTIRINRASLQRIVIQAYQDALRKFDQAVGPKVVDPKGSDVGKVLDDEGKKEKIVKLCKRLGMNSFKNHLLKTDLINRAASGDLIKK
tara:strand:+ start:1875 stop:2504 length:630 start_codon:yes stop_codon:yes gene_type:complete